MSARMKRSRPLTAHVLKSVYVLLGLLMLSVTGSAQSSVPICSDVFPAAITAPAIPPDVLTLPQFPSPNDGVLNLGNNASVSLGPGSIYYTGISTRNNVEININGPTILFVQSSAAFGNGNEINNPGNPADLVIIVYGTISVGNNTNLNGLIYSAGTVQLNNNTVINGAVTAAGSVGTHPNTEVIYDPDAVANADFGGLCENDPTPPELIVGNCAATPGFDTINEAIDAAGEGDTIRICPGVYNQQINIHTNRSSPRNLTIESFDRDRDSVTVRGDGTQHTVYIQLGGIDLTFRDFRIEGPNGRDGIQTHATTSGALSLENMLVESGNTAVNASNNLRVLVDQAEIVSRNEQGLSLPNEPHELRNITVSAPEGSAITATSLALLEDFDVKSAGRVIELSGNSADTVIQRGRVHLLDDGAGMHLTSSTALLIEEIDFSGEDPGGQVMWISSTPSDERSTIRSICSVGIRGIRSGQAHVLVEESQFADYGEFRINTSSGARARLRSNAFLKTTTPRAQTNSTENNFDGNYWQGFSGVQYVDGNVIDNDPLAAPPALRCPRPDAPALVAEYLMEQPSWSGSPGEVLDTSGRGFHGTAEGSTNTVVTSPARSGNPGTCRYGEFDGVDSGIFVGNEIDFGFGNELTVMAWVRWAMDPGEAPATNQWANIFTSNATSGSGDNGQFWLQHSQLNDAFEIAVQTDEVRRFQLSSTAPEEGVWYHVAGVYDGPNERLRIYVNGELEGHRSIQGSSVAAPAGNATHIGRWSRPTFRRFPGNIDEVRAFSRALDADEIQQWMETRRPCEEQPLNHIRLEHSGAGLICQAESITVRACADSACGEEYNEQVTLEFTSPTGNWSPSSLSFTGQATVGLQVTEPGSVVLNAVSNPAAPVRCFVGAVESCAMDWAEAGFLIDIPDHVSATTANGVIRAVRSDDEAQACVPAFDDISRDVDFWSQYVNPADGTLGVTVNGVGVAGTAPGSAVALNFDADGAAPLSVMYPDAGRMRLDARFVGSGDEEGLVMTGHGEFVVRPWGFGLEAAGNPGAGDADGRVFGAAGDPFEIVVSALNAAGNVTPNFGREMAPEQVSLDLELVAPVGGVEPGLSGNLSAFGAGCSSHNGQPGTACGDEFRFAEVGIIRLQPRLSSGAYLGTEDVVGEWSGSIGRFIPSHFHLSGASLIDRAALDGCTDDFTYLGERMEAEFSLVARSTSDALTANYTGDFARLGAGQLGLAASPAPEFNGTTIDWVDGIGFVETSLTGPRNGPDGPHDPFELTITPVDADGVALAGDNLIGTTRLLFGRLVIDNAIGSELGPLDLPWRVEVWEDATWRVNTADTCTAMDPGGLIVLENGHGATASGLEAIAVEAGGATTAIVEADSILTADRGHGHLRLSAPLAPGWVEVLLGLNTGWQFLRDDLDDDGDFEDNPSSRATWGLFDGNKNRILLREVLPR